MPTLLTIPREIRDQIYGWTLSDTLASFQSRDLQRERKRLTHFPSDPETLFGEDAVQYPVHTSLPPAHGLLHTTRQIRNEFLDSIKRLGSIRYKVDLVDRKDRGVLAPTWISVPCLPCFTDRIDVSGSQLESETRQNEQYRHLSWRFRRLSLQRHQRIAGHASKIRGKRCLLTVEEEKTQGPYRTSGDSLEWWS